MSNLQNNINECARLLYWIYFKPYTLKRWLQDIHPDLKAKDNPYFKLKQFPNNKPLRRYAGQVFWLTVITPQLAILLLGLIYTTVTQASFKFNWLISESNYVGWIFCQIISRYRYGFLGKNLQFIAVVNLILTAALLTWGAIPHVLFGVAWGVVLGVAWNVASGVLFSVAWGVVLGVAWGVKEFSITWGVAWGVAWGVVSDIILGVVWGATLGIVWGAMHNNGTYGLLYSILIVLGVLRVYFWLPELLWVGLLFIFTHQGRFASRLRYLPPYFDQLIRLPLPFMSTMIVEAYRENSEKARETIAYLTNFTNQQKVAARATVNITLDTLEGCRTLHDIIAITEELTWISSPPSREIGTVLPQFLDISRSVQSADMATSVYRKTELLKIPIDSLTQIQQSFAFIKNPRIATASSNIAQKWLSILETARRNLKEQSRYAQEIPLVYIAGNALDPETAKNRFKGRQDIFREIEKIALMSPPPTLLLYGGRRTGKTSTLKYLPQKVGGNLIPLRVDIQGIADAVTLSGVAKSLVQQIIDSARTSRNLTLPHPDAEELKTDPFPTLRNWFTIIERTARGKRFLLCLDEFERLEEVIAATKSRAPLNFLRHIIQHRTAWTLLFSGSHTLDEMKSYWSDYLINTREVRVTYLEKPEAEELIVHPVPDFPEIYLPGTVERIIYWTSCQPYLVQLLCCELVDYLNKKHPQNALKIKATPQDVDDIIPKALISGNPYFDELWRNSLNEQQRECMRNLINKVTLTPENRKIWRKLIQKEILEHDNQHGVRFQVPLIERSIREKIEEEF